MADRAVQSRHGGTTVAALVSSLQPEFGSLGAASLAMSRELVAALLDMPRSWPLLHPDEPVDASLADAAHAAAHRLAAGAPLAYAVRRASFRSLVLYVDERVLIPRHETELLIDVVLELVGPRRGGIVADVGTGSGAIALSLACEGPFERVVASDVSRDALAVAALNAERLRDHLCAPVELFHGSLLGPLPDVPLRCIVSNPPYIALGEAPGLPASVRDWEPPVALYGGTSGMDAIAALVRQAAGRLEPGGWLVMEVDSRRASTAAELLATDGRYSDILVRLDLTGRERFAAARRR